MADTHKIDPTKTVRVLRAIMDDLGGDVVVRGTINPDSLPLLKVDRTYQREALSAKLRKDLYEAIRSGDRLPDLDLALRGTDMYDTEPNGQTMGMLGPVYIIDGHQRWTTALDYRNRFGTEIFLGCNITLNTTVEFERHRFLDLGLNRRKISASLLLRDHKEDIPLIGTLFGLTTGRDKRPMVLNGRVAWDQVRGHNHLINGLQFCSTALTLHSHLTPTASSAKDTAELLNRLERLISLGMFRQNVVTFWNALEDAWHFSETKTALGRKVLNLDIIQIIAQVMSEHENFWKPPQANHTLQISADMIKQLQRIDTQKLHRDFAGTGMNKGIIKNTIIDEMNKGKSSQKLRKRDDRGWREAAE